MTVRQGRAAVNAADLRQGRAAPCAGDHFPRPSHQRLKGVLPKDQLPGSLINASGEYLSANRADWTLTFRQDSHQA